MLNVKTALLHCLGVTEPQTKRPKRGIPDLVHMVHGYSMKRIQAGSVRSATQCSNWTKATQRIST